MQTVYDREVTLHSRNAQGRNALTERAGRAAVFYKPAHARKTQPGAWRRLAAVALCCGALLCAFRLYGRARSRFGVQLPVRTVLQNPELPNGCEAASLAALLNYKGVPADKLRRCILPMVISRAAISKKPRTAAPGLTQSWPMRATQPRAWAFTASHSRWHRGRTPIWRRRARLCVRRI